MLQQPATPVMIELAAPLTEEISVADVLASALGVSGWIILTAVVLAVIFAGLLIALRQHSSSQPLNPGQPDGTRLDLHLPSS